MLKVECRELKSYSKRTNNESTPKSLKTPQRHEATKKTSSIIIFYLSIYET